MDTRLQKTQNTGRDIDKIERDSKVNWKKLIVFDSKILNRGHEPTKKYELHMKAQTSYINFQRKTMLKESTTS